MKESYLVPDYFPKFACKMGECRHPCCKGWPISISTDDYFRLLSVSCGPAMRERLNNAVRVSLHPTPEAYAQIAPTWAGDCPLHLPDGRCSVHAMLGADALPTICRLYPRGIRVEDGNECSCANSCEAVIELMMGQKEPIRFVRADLELNPPKAAERAFFFETVGKAQRIRLYFIEIMQRRALTLPQRLMTPVECSDSSFCLTFSGSARFVLTHMKYPELYGRASNSSRYSAWAAKTLLISS